MRHDKDGVFRARQHIPQRTRSRLLWRRTGGPGGRFLRVLWPVAFGAALLLLVAPPGAWARKGDTRGGLFVGTTTFTVDGYRTFGTQFGGHYGFEVSDDLVWSFGGTFTSTEGEDQVDVAGTPTTVLLRGTTAAFRTGLAAYFNRRSAVVPYVGAGVSYMNYTLDYPNTSVGTTSGAGPGAYAHAGIEFQVTPSISLIPQFGLEVHTIRTETGSTKGLLSGGLVFTVRIST